MIFTSAVFLVFFATVFGVYWGVLKGPEARLRLLLAASAVFYGWWDWRFLALIGAVIAVAYVAALGARPRPEAPRRTWPVWVGIALLLGLLGVFKYFNFFVASAEEAMSALGLQVNPVTFQILLPVGISFYVFQAISYVVDTWRGDVDAERRVTRVALYVAFFPQLVAGPIVRAAKFFPQMARAKTFSTRRLAMAGRMFLIGFVYKALLADNLAPLADPVFADMAAYSNWAVVGATMVFAAQIYFDFAGYSLMAQGVGAAFGYTLPRNFAQPFTAASTTEYWRRWHLSLSTFLRDYLYKPLGGHDGPTWFYYRNLMITMFLGGLWHGAAWTFVVWGTLQGVALVIHKAWRRYVERPFGMAERLPTVGYWIFGLLITQLFIIQQRGLFRAEDMADGLAVFAAFAGLREGGAEAIALAAWFVPVLVIVDALIGRHRRLGLHLPTLAPRPRLYWAAAGATTALALAVYPLQAAPFVYFQF